MRAHRKPHTACRARGPGGAAQGAAVPESFPRAGSKRRPLRLSTWLSVHPLAGSDRSAPGCIPQPRTPPAPEPPADSRARPHASPWPREPRFSLRAPPGPPPAGGVPTPERKESPHAQRAPAEDRPLASSSRICEMGAALATLAPPRRPRRGRSQPSEVLCFSREAPPRLGWASTLTRCLWSLGRGLGRDGA